jgi:CRP/FNR family transcriptional regulator, cyclic AMP receptor protein
VYKTLQLAQLLVPDELVHKRLKATMLVDHQRNVALQALPLALRLAVADVAILRVYEDGDIIIEQGREADGLYGISAGVGALWHLHRLGRKALLGFVTAGNWFGESSLLSHEVNTERLAARGRVHVTFIPRTRFEELLKNEPTLWPVCAEWLRLKLKHANEALAESCSASLQQRLAATLLELRNILPSALDGDDPPDTTSFSMTQEDLALHLGATRQRINQIMRIWEKNDWVTTDYRRITLKNPVALKKVAEI